MTKFLKLFIVLTIFIYKQAVATETTGPTPEDFGSPLETTNLKENAPYNEKRTNKKGQVYYHTGIDIDLENGDPVYAVYDGEVVFAGYHNAYGNYIIIKHSNSDVHTLYAHLEKKSVEKGDHVEKGIEIGKGDTTGASTGAHLHFEVFTAEGYGNSLSKLFAVRKYQNPEDWLVNCTIEKKKTSNKKKGKGGPTETITARDPNAMYGKQGMVSAGETLEYTVEFENEGEGIAYGVYITDKLDENFDDSTLKILSTERVDWQNTISTSCNFEYRYSPDTRLLTIFVDNGGEVLSKQGGRIRYSLKVKDNAPPGTVITNYAIVYFPSVPEITPTNAIVSVIPYHTRIDYVGETKVYQGKIPEIKAKLTTLEGNIIPYQQVIFKINNEVYTSTTQVDGIAREYPEVASPGTYTINIEFGGDGFYNLPSSGEGILQIQPPPSISYFEITVPNTTTTNSLFDAKSHIK